MHPLQSRQKKNKTSIDWILQSMDGQKEQKATKTIIADRPKNYRELLLKDQESQRKTSSEQKRQKQIEIGLQCPPAF